MIVSDNIFAMEPLALQRFVEYTRLYFSGDLKGKVPDEAIRSAQLQQQGRRTERTAVVPIEGPIMKVPAALNELAALLGIASPRAIAEQVRAAAQDEDVSQIMLLVDSPGGSVSGLTEAVDAVFNARESKPIVAQVDGVAASAAYMIASQAHEIRLGRGDMLGSIGTRLQLFDLSRMFENEGIESVVIDTGEFKSAGALGTQITERQREDFQRIVDRFFSDFVQAVMRGRGMTEAQVMEVADGRLFVGSEATENGLADSVMPFEETVAALTNRSAPARVNARLRLSQASA